MKIHFNTMVKNEEDLLKNVLPIWKKYPIDKFVFYNDNSTDNTIDVINYYLEHDRYMILNDKLEKFSESHNRSRMLEYSRYNNADFVFCIDCDELLSENIVTNLEYVLKIYEKNNLLLYWYNVVEDTLNKTRQDPQYINNYRSFILPIKYTGKFDLSLWQYHTPRTPQVFLPAIATKDIGIIHLQSINRKFYAFKQLWYKHFEFKEYKHSAEHINNKYDPVINNLEFNYIATPKNIVGNLHIDSKIYDIILEKKGYYKYIKENFNKDLITFGKEYFNV